MCSQDLSTYRKDRAADCGTSSTKRRSTTHRHTPLISGLVPAGHVTVVVVVVSLCEGEGEIVVVVTSLRGGGEELKEIHPVNSVDAKMTAIKF